MAGVQSPCSTGNCPIWQYSPSKCSAYANSLCLNCTNVKVGYYKASNCSLTMDSLWNPCSAGYYCDGSGSQSPCPINRTSQSGAQQLSECYCQVQQNSIYAVVYVTLYDICTTRWVLLKKWVENVFPCIAPIQCRIPCCLVHP